MPEYIAHLLELDEREHRPPTLDRAKSLLKDVDFSKFDDAHVEKLLDQRRRDL